jgi:hypothetical protein
MGVNWVEFIPYLKHKDPDIRKAAANQLFLRHGIIQHIQYAIGVFGDHEPSKEKTIKLCDKYKKDPPSRWNEMRGVGERETIPEIAKAIKNEQDEDVLSVLKDAYVQLIIRFCLDNEIKQYETIVGEKVIQDPNIGYLQDYIDFCRKGNLSLVSPLYSALSKMHNSQNPPIAEILLACSKEIYIHDYRSDRGKICIQFTEAILEALKDFDYPWIEDELLSYFCDYSYTDTHACITKPTKEFLLLRPDRIIDGLIERLERFGSINAESLLRNIGSISVPRLINALNSSIDIKNKIMAINILSDINDSRAETILKDLAKIRLFNKKEKSLRIAARDALKGRHRL